MQEDDAGNDGTNRGQKASTFRVMRGKMPQLQDLFCFRLDEVTHSCYRFSESSDRKYSIKKSTHRTNSFDHHAHELVLDRLYLASVSESIEMIDGFHYIETESIIYDSKLLDESVPVNLQTISDFCSTLDAMMQKFPEDRFVLRSNPACKTWTNTVLLIGSFMLLNLGSSLESVKAIMKPVMKLHAIADLSISAELVENDLRLVDYWEGLNIANQHGWFCPMNKYFDPAEYAHYANRLNADLNEIIPGKMIAMRGPKSLPQGVIFQDTKYEEASCQRDFSPEHYIQILHQFEVKVVVRLNQPEYDKQVLIDAGIAVADLFFDEDECPSPDIVAKFMMIAEGVQGAVAVHSDAGLGRTGTLIALYTMTHHGFSARQAMAWLRIVRPGSVARGQQRYLCEREAVMRRMAVLCQPSGALCAEADAGVAGVMRLIEAAGATVDFRMAALCRRTAGRRKSAP